MPTFNDRETALNTVIYLQSGAHDPRIVPTKGAPSTLYFKNNGYPGLFQKIDEGTTTNWALIKKGDLSIYKDCST